MFLQYCLVLIDFLIVFLHKLFRRFHLSLQ